MPKDAWRNAAKKNRRRSDTADPRRPTPSLPSDGKAAVALIRRETEKRQGAQPNPCQRCSNNARKGRTLCRKCVREVEEAELEQLQDLASDHSLTVRRVKHHVMFDNLAGERVLNWWTNGTIWSERLGKKRKVESVWAALDEAARLEAERLLGSEEQPP